VTLPPLEDLEVHSGVVVGPRQTAPPPPLPILGGGSAREVLETILEDALRQPPLHVAFSGGRDSSAILAAATHVARGRGLPEPIPLTAEYDDPRAREKEWQELVIRHLGIREWERFHVTSELDVLGELAVEAMRRHGPFWPPMAHNMLNMTAHAREGTLLTGGGGDELLAPWAWRRVSRASLRRLPLRRRMKWTVFGLLPLPARQSVAMARWGRHELPWLRPSAQAELNRRARAAPRGRTYAESIELYLGGRYYELLRAVLETFAADNGVRLVEPFYDPRLAVAVAREAPAAGFPTRTAAFEHLVGDLLPEPLLQRSTKAVFTASLWGSRSRAFAAEWDGRGLDAELIDPEALRTAWTRDPPDVRALAALQHAYWRSRLSVTTSSS